MKGLLNFLFGKSPDIFDENGQVRHKLPDEKWNSWAARYKKDTFNWRKHTGASIKQSGSKSRNANS